MKKSPSIFPILLIALLAGGLTLFFLLSLRADTDVVVAARAIGVGARLSAEDLTVKKVRSGDALPGAVKTVDEAVGQVIGVQRLPGDQVTANMLGAQAVSAIAAGLAPDHRAIAVTVSRSAGLAGIVRPGDTVTLIAVIEPPTDNNNSASPLSGTSTGSVGLLPTPEVSPASTPVGSSGPLKPITPFARVTASGLKVLLVPQTFRYEETTASDSQGFAAVQSSQVGQSEGVIVLDVPVTPLAVKGISGTEFVSLPELIALLDTQAKIYLVLEPPTAAVYGNAPGVAIEQLVGLGVGVLP